jgi:hypothetical protein
VDLDTVARELYTLAPSEFTASRDLRAGEARREGDRAAAAAIKEMKRPSPPAWALNLLAHERPEDLARLAGLGEQLRAAQSELRGDELRLLGRQRQGVVAGLAGEARSLAAARGHPISEAAGRQVEETLNAALADPEAARAVASGRLVRPLEYSGMGPVDLDRAVAAGPVPAAKPAHQRDEQRGEPSTRWPEKGRKEGPDKEEADLAARRAEVEASRQQLQMAQATVRRAEMKLRDSEAGLEHATRRRGALDDAVHRLEDELAAARQDADAAAAAADDALRARDAAQLSLEAARREQRAAEEAVSEAHDRSGG